MRGGWSSRCRDVFAGERDTEDGFEFRSGRWPGVDQPGFEAVDGCGADVRGDCELDLGEAFVDSGFTDLVCEIHACSIGTKSRLVKYLLVDFTLLAVFYRFVQASPHDD